MCKHGSFHLADLDSETTEVLRSLGQGPVLTRFERSPAHLCLRCAAHRAGSGSDSFPPCGTEEPAGIWQIVGLRPADKAGTLPMGRGGVCGGETVVLAGPWGPGSELVQAWRKQQL